MAAELQRTCELRASTIRRIGLDANRAASMKRPQPGRKVFALQMLPTCDESFDDGGGGRWITIRYILLPQAFGTVFGCAKLQSCRFVIARLVALMAKPRVNFARFHEMFALSRELKLA